MRNKVEVIITGKKFKIACPTGHESALFAAANELNSRIEKLDGTDSIATPEQAMLMVALNLANDLLQTQQVQEKERQETASKITLLQTTIEQALAPQNQSA